MGQPKLFSFIDKVCYEYGLIEKGDKILIGASGGKDSSVLIEYLAMRSKRKDAGFTFTALHIQSEFSPNLPKGFIELYKKWDVDYREINIDVQGRLKPGKKMNCYWCSTQRRKELSDFAVQNGYNKIALGHHMDDVLETLIMNALGKSQLSTMTPSLQYENYPYKVIRPLFYCPEDLIVEHAKEQGYYGFTCTCNFQENSSRKSARKKLEYLTDGEYIKKVHLLKALKNINTQYLP